ncbi:hypothetical protein SK128_010151 [Halocaridina rubra]|uniref:C-type lectin domain-containing protein n=1 Tax=Halocaridina rubra TaxID=373956 RepID=A0AAN8XEU6_HALRR
MYSYITVGSLTVIRHFDQSYEGSDMNFESPVNASETFRSQSHQGYTRVDCPTPYMRIAGLCLRMGTRLQKLSWNDARAYCAAIDGDLSTLDFKLEMVMAYSKGEWPTLQLYSSRWLGARRTDDEAPFYWLDGEVMPDPKSSLWIYQDIPGFNCVALNRTQEYESKLINYNCSDTISSICQLH